MTKRPILLDGGAGTLLWNMAEERGIEKKPTWTYNIEHPEIVEKLHQDYISAGSEMIQTNTFSVNARSVSVLPGYSAAEIVTAAVRIALRAAANTKVKVYASFGPTMEMLEPMGELSEAECAGIYNELCGAAAEAGAEMIMLETFMDLRMMKIAAESAINSGLPVICSMTFFAEDKTMAGDSVEEICRVLGELGISGIGMNCSAGPVEALEIIRKFRQYSSLPLYFKPNSGMGVSYNAEQFAVEIAPAIDFVSYIGGCCGTDADYIKAISQRLG